MHATIFGNVASIVGRIYVRRQEYDRKVIMSKFYKNSRHSITRNSGRFAPFFLGLTFSSLINTMGVLRVNKNKKFRGFYKKILDFQNFQKIEFWLRHMFESSIIHKPSLGSREVQKKLGPIGSAVLMFIGYTRTYRQKNKQTSKVYMSICVRRVLAAYLSVRYMSIQYMSVRYMSCLYISIRYM